MRKSTISALLSAFVFPGIGHFYLHSYARGSALLIIAGAALFKFIKQAWQEVDLIRDQLITQINATGVIDLETLITQATTTIDGIDNKPFTIASFVMLVCWIIAIADSYRIGKKLEETPAQP